MSSAELKQINDNDWCITVKLPDEIISYLWSCVHDAEKANIDHRHQLAGNISRSLIMKDPDNIMIDKVFSGLFDSDFRPLFTRHVEKTFRHVFHYDKSYSKPASPLLESFWVNFQKKYEFNPLHDHGGMFSFVIWMKIPYDWENEKELPWVKGSNSEMTVGNFCFLDHTLKSHLTYMNKHIEGCMCIFPSHLHHMVYPFYTSDEERVSISGNIFFELEQ